MTLGELNGLSAEAARDELIKCCQSTSWADQMVKKRPFANEDELYSAATDAWFSNTRIDWQEAFGHDSKIGEDNTLEGKFAEEIQPSGEQPDGSTSKAQTLEKLSLLNQKYEKRFGYRFVVYTSAKSVEEILEIIELRLKNNPYDEIKIAASEKNRITKFRLKKLLS